MNIQFSPQLKKRSLYKDLDSLFRECISFKATLAYWTIREDFFKKSLTEALKKSNSFVCVDLAKPTDLYAINSFYYENVNQFYWHKYKISSGMGNDYKLLHSKVLLFDLPNNEAEIWVGSMNFTQTAINGLNIESITKIRCSQNENIYKETLEFLTFVKTELCYQYELSKLSYYEMLQQQSITKTITANLKLGKKAKVVSLFGININTIKNDDIIELFSINNRDYEIYKSSKVVYLQIADIQNNLEYLFEAKIIQVGNTEKDGSKIDFIGEKRYANIGYDNISFLTEPKNINHTYLNGVNFFVTLNILNRITDYSIYEIPDINSINLWETDNTNSYYKIIGLEEDEFCLPIQIAKKNYSNPENQKINLLSFEKEMFNNSRNLSEKIDLLKLEIFNDRSIKINPEYYFEQLNLLKASSVQERSVSIE
jgi:hypothetical protein